MRSDARGYVAVWMLVLGAAIVAAFTSIEFTVEDRPRDPAMLLACGIALGIAALGFFVEVKRDVYEASMVMTVVSFVTAIITGSIAWFGMQPHPIAATVAVLATATLVACVVFLLRTQYRRETLPNVLRQRFQRSSIVEVDGVQLVAAYAPVELPAGERFEIMVYAQNCWSAPRTLRFGLSQATRLSLSRAGLHFVREPSVTVPAAGVAVLTIPVLAHPQAKGRFELHAKPKVDGTGGNRVRHWRARSIGMRIPGWLSAALVLVGMFVWGGGLRFRVRVQGNRYGLDMTPSTPDPRTEIVWVPEAGTAPAYT